MQMIGNTSKQVLTGVAVLAFAIPLASASLLTVGAGGTYADLEAALVAAVADDTIQFVDSATYTMANDLSLTSKPGLTIDSAPGQRATLNFTGGTGANNGNYWGMIYGRNQTLRNIDIHFERSTALAAAGTNTTIQGVNFVMTSPTLAQTGMETASDVSVLHSTFYGRFASGGGGIGISLSGNNTGVLADHVSFDNLQTPIRNTNPNAFITLRNSAVGAFHSASWSFVFLLANGTDPAPHSFAAEDYNAVYGPNGLINPPELFKLTSGGNSIDAALYEDVFAGTTSNGDWRVADSLIGAASDLLAIGAWQTVVISTVEVANVTAVQFPSGSLIYNSMQHAGKIAAGASHTLHVHPVQLYESMGTLTLFFILLLTRAKKRFHGQLLLTYLFLYPILRSSLEFIRGDKERGEFTIFGDVVMSTSQMISIGIATVAVVLLAFLMRQRTRDVVAA